MPDSTRPDSAARRGLLRAFGVLGTPPFLSRSAALASLFPAGFCNATTKRADSLTDAALRFALPEPEGDRSALRLWATYYYIHQAMPAREGPRLLDLNGEAISPPLSPRDFCQGAIEGTLFIRQPDGSHIGFNHAGLAEREQIDCRPHVEEKSDWVRDLGRNRFRRALGPYGDGAQGSHGQLMHLVPFRSVATDPVLIPTGTALFIPAARNRTVKHEGRRWRHDGWFFAADVGPAIKGAHIDVFLGLTQSNPFGDWLGSQPGKTFDALRVASPAITAALRDIHEGRR